MGVMVNTGVVGSGRKCVCLTAVWCTQAMGAREAVSFLRLVSMRLLAGCNRNKPANFMPSVNKQNKAIYGEHVVQEIQNSLKTSGDSWKPSVCTPSAFAPVSQHNYSLLSFFTGWFSLACMVTVGCHLALLSTVPEKMPLLSG